MSKKFGLTLDEEMEKMLNYIASKLNSDKTEVVGRAIVLLRHAVDAAEIKFYNERGDETNVIIKRVDEE